MSWVAWRRSVEVAGAGDEGDVGGVPCGAEIFDDDDNDDDEFMPSTLVVAPETFSALEADGSPRRRALTGRANGPGKRLAAIPGTRDVEPGAYWHACSVD